MKRILGLAAPLMLLASIGCDDLVTHSVEGQVVAPGADLSKWGDAFVILQHEQNPKFRGDGRLAPDGRFQVQMLHEGRVIHGLPPGRYRAKIQIEDTGRPQAKLPFRKQFADFETSGFIVNVPSDGPVLLSVSRN
jgi:hypothetical protein